MVAWSHITKATVRHPRACGFSLIELIVAIAVIGIMMALFAPAIMQARESARMVECKNNLKQIGAAAPSGSFSGFGSMLRVLNLGREHKEVVASVFLCPTDGSDVLVPDSRWKGEKARTTYVGVTGDGTSQGIFRLERDAFYGWRTRIADDVQITDGKSNTFAVGEQDSSSNDPQWGWADAMHVLSPNASCRESLNALDAGGLTFIDGFGSRHRPGGGHFLLLDGSVRFVSESTDVPTYRALATIAGGEVVGEF